MALQVKNPYLGEWSAQIDSQHHREETIQEILECRQFDRLAAFGMFREAYQNKYSYGIPTEEALTTISEFAPLIEIGGGTGYWAWLLRQLGTDIICYDSAPPSADSTRNEFHPRSRCWTDVLPGDERKLDEHPDRTLFLCWPPARDSMAHRTLARYRGKIFLGVFEPPLSDALNGSTGDNYFPELLETSWALVRRVDLPHWELCWDSLFVFRANR